jgi:phosphoglycerate dehydrogenase-like enzyme
MSTAIAQPRLRVAFARAFALRLEQPARAHLSMPRDVILADEVGIVSRLSDVKILVTMAFTREMVGGLEIVDEVARRSDYLVISLPVTPETWGPIGEKQLHSMKPTAVLVNVSRAEIIDEEALYRALAEQTIAGAALDVWYHYPTAAGPTLPAHQPFHELANVLMTPHMSGWTDGMLAARAKHLAENIHRTARREPRMHLIPAAAE